MVIAILNTFFLLKIIKKERDITMKYALHNTYITIYMSVLVLIYDNMANKRTRQEEIMFTVPQKVFKWLNDNKCCIV